MPPTKKQSKKASTGVNLKQINIRLVTEIVGGVVLLIVVWSWMVSSLASSGGGLVYDHEGREDPFAIDDPLFVPYLDDEVAELDELNEETVEDLTEPEEIIAEEPEEVTIQTTETSVAQWDTLKNTTLGMQFDYPHIFQNGLKKSKKGEGIQIATYKLNAYYDGPAPPGIKLEVFRQKRSDTEKLYDFAVLSSEDTWFDIHFVDDEIDGHKALRRYVQQNTVVNDYYYFRDSDYFYGVAIFATAETYLEYADAIDRMIHSFELF